APPEQQMEMLSLTAQIVLDRLTPGGRLTTRLPGIRPRVFVIPESGFGPLRPPDEVILRCDTIWIDADRCLAMLTWRGVIPLLPGALAAAALVLALDQGDRKKTWAKALTQLDDAIWTAASGPDDASEELQLEDDLELEEDSPATDRMAQQAAASLADDARPALSLEDDEATRTLVHLPRASDAPDRAPLLVLGGLRGALASFEVKVPPGRPQRPAGLEFGRAEDSTGVAIGMPLSPQEVTTTLPFEAPARHGLTKQPRSRRKR
ncbi:MAG: DUF2169 domain-containing protein, partial [Byssovorax sp.]